MKPCLHAVPRGAASVLLVLATSLCVSGCDKSPTGETAGQKLDAAIDKTRDVASDVRSEAHTALRDAETRLHQDGPKVEARAREAATNAGSLIDDSAITARITAGLARDPDLSALKIDVDTKDGAVILRGPAPSAAARERAGRLARDMAGVRSVDNRLVLAGG